MRWLLPEHIEDILPGEAMRIELLRRLILDLFFKHGFELVMPPLVEFTDSLLTGTGMTWTCAPSSWWTSSRAARRCAATTGALTIAPRAQDESPRRPPRAR